MKSAQSNASLLSVVRRQGRRNLTLALVGGTVAERAGLREALAALSSPRIEINEISAPAQAPAQSDALGVLAVILGDDSELWDRELEQWVSDARWIQTIALVRQRTPDAVRAALQAGANEVLFLPADSVELARALLKISQTNPGSGHGPDKAAYALVSVAGGVGVSSLTVALALALRRITQKQVALVDLGLQADALAPMLDLAPAHSISDLTDPSTSIDSIRLESAICKHPAGLYLLGAPARIEDGEMISPGTVEATVGVMLQLFDFVMIDCGHHVSEASVAAWERAGSLFYVLDQSIPGVHATRRFLELFKRLNLKHVALDLVLNNYRHGHAITLEKIESALEHPIGFCIPHDSTMAAADAAGDGLLGRPTSSPMAQAVESLANALLGIGAQSNGRARAGVLSRMLTAFGREER